jgi:hypothetical protein
MKSRHRFGTRSVRSVTPRPVHLLHGSPAVPERHTAAVVADRFDLITWRDTYEQSSGLRDLAEELSERHDYANDLLADAFLAAYKLAPRLRERERMSPSRWVNHEVIASLVASPEFAELRRETYGDPYAAAMAVLAQAAALRRMYEAGPGGITREAWAKACALALLDQARHARRDFVGILFSAADKVRVFRFPAGEPPASTGSSISRRRSWVAEPAFRGR